MNVAQNDHGVSIVVRIAVVYAPRPAVDMCANDQPPMVVISR